MFSFEKQMFASLHSQVPKNETTNLYVIIICPLIYKYVVFSILKTLRQENI